MSFFSASNTPSFKIDNNFSQMNRSSSLWLKNTHSNLQQNKEVIRSYSKDTQLSPRSKMMKFIPLIKMTQLLTSKVKKHQYFLWCRLQNIKAKKQEQYLPNIQKSLEINKNTNDFNSLDKSATITNLYSHQQQLNKNEGEITDKSSQNCIKQTETTKTTMVQQHQTFSQKNSESQISYKNESLILKQQNLISQGISKLQKIVSKKILLKMKGLKSIKNYANFKIKAQILSNTLTNFSNYKQNMKQPFKKLKQFQCLNTVRQKDTFQSSNNIKLLDQSKINISISQKQINKGGQIHNVSFEKTKTLQIINTEQHLQNFIKKVVKECSKEGNNLRSQQKNEIFLSYQTKSSMPLQINLISKRANKNILKLQDCPFTRIHNNIFYNNLQAMKKTSHLYPESSINQILDCFDSSSIFNTEFKNNIPAQIAEKIKKKNQQNNNGKNQNIQNQRLVTQKIEQYNQVQSEAFQFSKTQQSQQFHTVNSCATLKYNQKKKPEVLKLVSKQKSFIKFGSKQKKKNYQLKFQSGEQKKYTQMRKSSSCRQIIPKGISKQHLSNNKNIINIQIPLQMQKQKQIYPNKNNRVLSIADCNKKYSCNRLQWKSDKKTKYNLLSCENKQNIHKGYSDQKTVRINRTQCKQRNIPCSQFLVEPIQNKINGSMNEKKVNGSMNENKKIQFSSKNKRQKQQQGFAFVDIQETNKKTSSSNILGQITHNIENSSNINNSVITCTKSKTNLRSKLDKVQYNTAKKMKLEIQNIINQRKKSSIGVFKI